MLRSFEAAITCGTAESGAGPTKMAAATLPSYGLSTLATGVTEHTASAHRPSHDPPWIQRTQSRYPDMPAWRVVRSSTPSTSRHPYLSRSDINSVFMLLLRSIGDAVATCNLPTFKALI